MTIDTPPVLRVPARELPIPTSISEAAQGFLAGVMFNPAPTYPPVERLDDWRAMVAAADEFIVTMLGPVVAAAGVESERRPLGGVPAWRLLPDGVDPGDGRVYLFLHGGALVMGGGEACRIMSIRAASRLGALTWAVDYRLPPDHPFPTPVDDCLAAYRALLEDHRPEQIVVGGESAGGNLVAAMILRARDEGLPLPAGAVLCTPELDLTESGDSFKTNAGLDPILGHTLMNANLLYAGGHQLEDPYVSPLFADFSLGFPPTILTTGTRDLFLSNTVRMHRALRSAGVEAELHVLEAAPHGGFYGMAPEDVELDREVRRFVDRRWGAGGVA
jgi:monoterpene epsilon-lactone hydrolase